MQRITFKKATCLVALIASVSLIPIAYAQIESHLDSQSMSSQDLGVSGETNKIIKPDNGVDQSEPDSGNQVDSLKSDTIDSLREEIVQLRLTLGEATNRPEFFGINLDIIFAVAAFLALFSSLVSCISLWFTNQLDKDFHFLRTSFTNLDRNIHNELTLKFGELEIYQATTKSELKADIKSAQKIGNSPEANISSQRHSVSPAPPLTSITADQFSDPTVVRPSVPSLEVLIEAINAGNRQTLRDLAKAELNITSDSESSLAMGRAITTELEVVPGGGSYWLIELQGQAWLFPTDRTLSGYGAVQPVKGIFKYEQQIISKAQLIKPAALEGSGNLWRVKTMGSVAIP